MQTRRQKVRHTPQISLNLLGEFMVSSFVRRRSILRRGEVSRGLYRSPLRPGPESRGPLPGRVAPGTARQLENGH